MRALILLAVVLAAGCASSGLEARVGELERENADLRSALEKWKEFGEKVKADRAAAAAPKQKVELKRVEQKRVVSGIEPLGGAEEGRSIESLIDREAFDRAGRELRELNGLIDEVAASHRTAGGGRMEYARSYESLLGRIEEVRGGQQFFREVIEPDLRRLPPAPSDEAWAALREWQKEMALEANREARHAEAMAAQEDALMEQRAEAAAEQARHGERMAVEAEKADAAMKQAEAAARQAEAMEDAARIMQIDAARRWQR